MNTPAAPFRACRAYAVLACLPLLAACTSPVLTARSEAEANEALAALLAAGVDAEKAAAARGTFDVTVPSGRLPEALAVLGAAGLPRVDEAGLAELFEAPGLVPSPLEEQVRHHRAVAGELARTLRSLDGVRDARVHLGLPVEAPSRPGRRPPPRAVKASVLLAARTGRAAALEARVPELRALVAGAVPGLDPAAVTLVVAETTAPAPPPAPVPGRPRAPVLLTLGLVTAASGGGLLSFRFLKPGPFRWPVFGRRPEAAP